MPPPRVLSKAMFASVASKSNQYFQMLKFCCCCSCQEKANAVQDAWSPPSEVEVAADEEGSTRSADSHEAAARQAHLQELFGHSNSDSSNSNNAVPGTGVQQPFDRRKMGALPSLRETFAKASLADAATSGVASKQEDLGDQRHPLTQPLSLSATKLPSIGSPDQASTHEAGPPLHLPAPAAAAAANAAVNAAVNAAINDDRNGTVRPTTISQMEVAAQDLKKGEMKKKKNRKEKVGKKKGSKGRRSTNESQSVGGARKVVPIGAVGVASSSPPSPSPSPVAAAAKGHTPWTLNDLHEIQTDVAKVALSDVMKARRALLLMPKEDFAGITAFAKPPPHIFKTMTAVQLLLGRDQDDTLSPSNAGFFDAAAFKRINSPEKSVWSWTQIVNRATPHERFVRQVYGCGLEAVLLLPQGVAAVRRMRDEQPAFSAASVEGTVCAPLRQWCIAMVDLVGLWRDLDPPVQDEIFEMAQAMVV